MFLDRVLQEAQAAQHGGDFFIIHFAVPLLQEKRRPVDRHRSCYSPTAGNALIIASGSSPRRRMTKPTSRAHSTQILMRRYSSERLMPPILRTREQRDRVYL